MSQSSYPPPHEFGEAPPPAPSSAGPSVGAGSGSTTDVAKDEAAQTKDAAVGAAQDVAATAQQQAAEVASEVQQRAGDLLGQVSDEVQSQGRTQQQRLAGGLTSAGQELDQMASNSDSGGVATEVTRQVSQQLSRAGTWLEQREPTEVLEEIRGFARRQPVAFLIGAGLAGFVVGRLARSVVANRTELDSPSSKGSSPQPAAEPAAITARPAPAVSLQEDTATPGAAVGAPAIADQPVPGDPDGLGADDVRGELTLPGVPMRGDVPR
ncbi:hypothetical protein [Parenemella sanctibonifatiensis]|uniref:DUF3618 domain-containing protein n=1 Tax=Parenemella sanctibonifatiensis TaxID=2016505 RepID=A0A255EMK5_9ACTN|nr:hypothetical protein [Parenemella sanctibonifatiensis]OYN90682.1 hypothetical protein CGZ92_00605 [Parenemella sanctibonifatiensis]